MSKTRILFVDDEVNVLEGLRRMLRRQRHEWDTVFVASGAEALGQLAAAPFDVVVTDMQMPGMNGAELLEKVMAKHPQVARIVLSGHTDDESGIRVLRAAHQFLSKPVDADTLKLAVERACAAREALPNPRVRSIAASVGTLPSPPGVYAEITRAAAAEEVSARDIAAVIARDPALSAKLLQLVNSSFFGLGRNVSSIEHAVALLGLIRIKSLILSAQILDRFRPTHPLPGFSVQRYLHRSMLTAQIARAISNAERQSGDRPNQAFAAGLLHDVGLLILAERQTDGWAEALRRTRQDQVPICAAEREVLGATHPEVGACLLELWGLPPRLVEGVLLHHSPNDTDFDGVCAVSAVHVAAALWPSFAPAGTPRDDEAPFVPELDARYLARIGRLDGLGEWKQSIAATLVGAEVQPA